MKPRNKFTLAFIVLILFKLNSQVSFSITSIGCTGVTQTLVANTGSNAVLGYTWSSSPLNILFTSPNSATTNLSFPISGIYTISLNVTFLNGIIGASNIVTVQATPTITVSQSSFTTCMASNSPAYSKPIVMSASGASFYAWNPYIPPGIIPSNGASKTVRPTASICYSVYGTTGSCTGTAVICMTVIPQFSITVSPTTASICKNMNGIDETAILSINSISSPAIGNFSSFHFSWKEPAAGSILTPPIAPTVTVSPLTNTTYTAEVTDSLGCISYPQFATVLVQNCTDLDKRTPKEIIAIFPNPVSDKFKISLNDSEKINNLIIMNTIGQIVYSASELPNEIDLSLLPIGVYYLHIQATGNYKVLKLLKE